MTSVEGMHGDQTIQEMILERSGLLMADEGPLVFCNLPPRKSVSEWEPPRMSYYNGNENLAVPFKWEATPGKPIANEPSRPDYPESPRPLRPPPSVSNSPLQPHVPPSYKDQLKSRLPPKFRSYSRPEATFPMTFRTNGNATTLDSSTSHQRVWSKGSMSRRSEFDWPEVSDDECSTTRTASEQEPPSSTATTGSAKNWSFSSSSFRSSSTRSQSPSPVNSGPGARGGGGSMRDLFLLRNVVNFSAAAPASPANCSVPLPARSPNEGSDFGDKGEEGDDHARPTGFLSCLPIFSKVRMVQSPVSNERPPAINFSSRLSPSRNFMLSPRVKNRSYKQSL